MKKPISNLFVAPFRMALRFRRRFRRTLVVMLHVALVPAAYYLAFGLRFDGLVPNPHLGHYWATLPALLVIKLGAFAGFGLFRGWWRHVGMYDLQALVKASTVTSLVFALFLVGSGQIPGYPRSVVALEWGVSLVLFGGLRFAVRWMQERQAGRGFEAEGRRTLIIGAGDAAAQLLRHIKQNPASGIEPVGLVDDDPNKRGYQVHGVPVLGTTRDLERLVSDHRIALLVLAIARTTREERRRIAEKCAGLNVEFKVVPALDELIDGRARLTQLRSVEPEDLLGRAPVSLDLERVASDLRGRVVLVTGAAGSIGSELARQVARFEPERLVLLEQAESPLYFVDFELGNLHPELDVIPVVADVTDLEGLEEVFARHRPAYVFHAAAYKHVPMMEANVAEAVRNNVFGTLRVAECAARYGVRKFVLISTDKAVRPSSVMGATKRIAERIVLAMPQLWQTSTDFRAVRFGNVLDSAGSVVPLFRRQIAAGGPVTVTHPDVTRYFMTIPEAVQLVLQAAALPEAARRISMLEMGDPVRILTMAENLIRLSGLEPYEEMPIVFTGMRPGEKLHEQLMSNVEASVSTSVEKVRVVQTSETDVLTIRDELERLKTHVEDRDRDRVIIAVASLAPECVPPLRDRAREAAAQLALRPAGLVPLRGGRELDSAPRSLGQTRQLPARREEAESA